MGQYHWYFVWASLVIYSLYFRHAEILYFQSTYQEFHWYFFIFTIISDCFFIVTHSFLFTHWYKIISFDIVRDLYDYNMESYVSILYCLHLIDIIYYLLFVSVYWHDDIHTTISMLMSTTHHLLMLQFVFISIPNSSPSSCIECTYADIYIHKRWFTLDW